MFRRVGPSSPRSLLHCGNRGIGQLFKLPALAVRQLPAILQHQSDQERRAAIRHIDAGGLPVGINGTLLD